MQLISRTLMVTTTGIKNKIISQSHIDFPVWLISCFLHKRGFMMVKRNHKEDNAMKNIQTCSLKELFENQLTSLPFSNSDFQSIDEVLSSDKKAVENINHGLKYP